MVLLLTKAVLLQPRCILAVTTAIDAGVPVIPLLLRGKGYDAEKTQQQLTFLDAELPRLNPSGSALLISHGLEPVDAARQLSQVVPKLAAVEFDEARPILVGM